MFCNERLPEEFFFHGTLCPDARICVDCIALAVEVKAKDGANGHAITVVCDALEKIGNVHKRKRGTQITKRMRRGGRKIPNTMI
jgi:hypothetical protein